MLPSTAVTVYVCGAGGRWHLTPTCGYLVRPRKRQPVIALTADWALRAGYWECPYCCPPPECCQQGQHQSVSLPRLAPADVPEWERASEGGVS